MRVKINEREENQRFNIIDELGVGIETMKLETEV